MIDECPRCGNVIGFGPYLGSRRWVEVWCAQLGDRKGCDWGRGNILRSEVV